MMNTLMDTNRNHILLSRLLVFFFALAVAALDAGAVFCVNVSDSAITAYIAQILPGRELMLFVMCLMLCNFPAFLLLRCMDRLLSNLQKDAVFTLTNVHLMQTISRCCFAAALFCLAFSFRLPGLLVIVSAAGFVGLIVRIVKNTFEQAILMKDELDLTV